MVVMVMGDEYQGRSGPRRERRFEVAPDGEELGFEGSK